MDSPIIMGDMNHGPALSRNITWLFPIHYGLVTAHGFFSPYVTEDGRCTWCLDNPATRASFKFQCNQVLDHMYIMDSSSKRVVNVKVHTRVRNMWLARILFMISTRALKCKPSAKNNKHLLHWTCQCTRLRMWTCTSSL